MPGGLVVVDDGSGDGRDRNAGGGVIRAAGGVGNGGMSLGGCVVQADEAERHRIGPINLRREHTGNLPIDGAVDDADALGLGLVLGLDLG